MTNRHWPPSREYSLSERVADAVVHSIGLLIALAAGAMLLVLAAGRAGLGEYSALVVYVAALVTVMTVSLIYNWWPISPIKTFLRRFDHAAIFLLIAATYTPFAVQLADHRLAASLLAVVWGGALLGMSLKLFLPGRYDRTAILFYLLIGWSGAVMFAPLSEVLPASTIGLVAAGGVAYTSGLIFYALHKMRFQTAIWHAFVVTGAALHLAAVTDFVTARA